MPMARAAALALGPALGVMGLAAAMHSLLQDKAAAEAMESHGRNLVGAMVAFFAHAGRSREANTALMALFTPLLLVVNALYGLEARSHSRLRRHSRFVFARREAAKR